MIPKEQQRYPMRKVTPQYICGFVDGEGCFTLHIVKRAQSPFGLYFTPSFSVSQNTRSVHVLEEIQHFFGCGFIRKDRHTSKYEVRDATNLQEKIIPFFKKNPLHTTKNLDFTVFCQICDLLKKKAHFEKAGVAQLIDLAYSMNQSGKHRRRDKNKLLEDLDGLV